MNVEQKLFIRTSLLNTIRLFSSAIATTAANKSLPRNAIEVLTQTDSHVVARCLVPSSRAFVEVFVSDVTYLRI